MNKKGWLVVAGVAVLLGGYVYRTYPRHVAMTLHGVQYRLGSHGRGLQQVTLTLNGTRDQPIFGSETFYGTVDISGATFPDHGNGQLIKLQFVSGVGGAARLFGFGHPTVLLLRCALSQSELYPVCSHRVAARREWRLEWRQWSPHCCPSQQPE